MKSTLAAAALMLVIVSAVLGAEGPAAGKVVFEAVDGPANGTAAIFADWKTRLLARRGGKLGSHDWWWWGIGTLDYDNDGAADLVATVHGPPNGVILKSQWQQGKLTFRNVTEELGAGWMVPGTNWNPVFWDFDGDGWVDIWAVGHDQPGACLFNEAGKRFVPTPFKSSIYNNPRVEDLNGDGHCDVWHNFRFERQEMLYDPAGRSFQRRVRPSAPPPGTPQSVLKAIDALREGKAAFPMFTDGHDLNGDGVADVVFHSFGSFGKGPCQGRYLIADGKGALVDRSEEMGLPVTGTPILLEDLTGDGAPEVLIAADPKAGLYLNDGRGHFTLKGGPLTQLLARRLPYAQRALPADLDNSGRTSLVISTRRGESQHVFGNLGGGEFRQELAGDAWIDGVGVADLDDDGRLDLFVGRKDISITVYLNRTARPGHWIKLIPRMDKPNWAAVGAAIEVFKPGDLDRGGARPLCRARAHPNAMPIHVGLGEQASCDVRVTFPGRAAPVEFRSLAADGKWRLTPDRKSLKLPK